MQDPVESLSRSPSPPPPAQWRAGLRRFFVSGDGRVALGWRLVLYFAAIVAAQAIAAGAELLARTVAAPQALRGLATALVYAGATLGLVLILRRKIDRRAVDALGLGGGSRRVWSALAGAAVGLVMLAAVVAIESSAGWVRVEGVVPWSGAVAGRVAGSLLVFCAVGFCEELVFRGAFLANLAERHSVRAATIVSALILGGAHVLSAPPKPAVLVSALTVTALLVAARVSTGALWWAIGWHAAWDFGQHHLFGLAEPGADAPATALVRLVQSGPALWVGAHGFMESGIVVIVVQGVAAALLTVTAARLGCPVRWSEPVDQ